MRVLFLFIDGPCCVLVCVRISLGCFLFFLRTQIPSWGWTSYFPGHHLLIHEWVGHSLWMGQHYIQPIALISYTGWQSPLTGCCNLFRMFPYICVIWFSVHALMVKHFNLFRWKWRPVFSQCWLSECLPSFPKGLRISGRVDLLVDCFRRGRNRRVFWDSGGLFDVILHTELKAVCGRVIWRTLWKFIQGFLPTLHFFLTRGSVIIIPIALMWKRDS